MAFLKKLKGCGLAVFAMVVIVSLLMACGVVPFNANLYWKFIVGAVVFSFGEALFLLGADSGIMEMGKKIGSNIKRFKSIWVMLGICFVLSFALTMAEPDIQFFLDEVTHLNPNLSSIILLVCFAIGVACFVSFGIIRIFKNIKMKYVFLAVYAVVFLVAAFLPSGYLCLAFDASGVTTGPITVPILLAIAAGISGLKTKSSKDDSFGLVGIASLGPIFVILIMGLFVKAPTGNIDMSIASLAFGTLVVNSLLKVLIAFAPICVLFFVLNLLVLKLPKKEILRISISVIISYIGLVMFLIGIYFGFAPMAEFVGGKLGEFSLQSGGAVLVIFLMGVLGYILVYTEPAISFLAKQIYEITNGFIKRKVFSITLGTGMALALILSVVKIIFEINIWYILAPIMVIAVLLSFFTSNLFAGMAFDTGAVAVGSMMVAFVLPIIIGIASALGVSIFNYAFGIIALVATVPIICVESIGVIYAFKIRRRAKDDVHNNTEVKIGK